MPPLISAARSSHRSRPTGSTAGSQSRRTAMSPPISARWIWARGSLVEMVSTGIQKGGIADRFDVADSVVAASGDPTRRVSYGELIGGRYFDLPMTWNARL